MSVTFIASAKSVRVAVALVVWVVLGIVWMVVLSKREHGIGSKDCLWRRVGVVRDASVKVTYNATTSQAQASYSTDTRSIFDQRLKYYSSQIFKPLDQGNCTLVMLTYKRIKILPRVVKHYCEMKQLQRILVIWNNVDISIPKFLLNLTSSCSVDLKFILSVENKLTNRYIPRKEIETDCVCLMDDDRLVSSHDMEFGFDSWKNFRHRIVGFEERSFVLASNKSYIYTGYERRRFFDKALRRDGSKKISYTVEIVNDTRLLHVQNKTYILGKSSVKKNDRVSLKPDLYLAQKSEGYSIMLNSCFIHRVYLEMYSDPLMVPAGIIQYIERIKNCEDILMSMVVTKFLRDINWRQCGVLALKAMKIENLEDEGRDDDDGDNEQELRLSAREDHYLKRSECLNYFSQLYGYLPLQLSTVIMSHARYQ